MLSSKPEQEPKKKKPKIHTPNHTIQQERKKKGVHAILQSASATV